jgi:hypothetical protein
VSELNLILVGENQELETKLAKESQGKDDEHLIDLFIFVIKSCLSDL